MTYKPNKFATDRLSARAVRLIWQLSLVFVTLVLMGVQYQNMLKSHAGDLIKHAI